jgi:hypothetical protein
VLFAVLVHGHLRAAGCSRLLRGGLRIAAAATVGGLGWVACGGAWPWVALALGLPPSVAGPLGPTLGIVSISLWLVGSVLIAWSLRLGPPFRWLRTLLDWWRLTPLWAALHEPRSRPTGYRSIRNVDFALYRRLIEINDGQLALRAHLPSTAPDWAARALASAGIGDEPRRSAMHAATEIAAALAARTANVAVRPADPPDSRPDPAATPVDRAAETAWLIAVTREFTTSPIVAQARLRFGPDQTRRAA